MTVLVTGGGGFVGLNALQALLARGETVVSVSRRPLDAWAERRLAKAGGRLVQLTADVRDRAALRAALVEHGVETVIHMAAVTSAADRERTSADEVVSVNMGGTASLLTAAAEGQVKRFIYTSSIAVFGPTTPDGGVSSEKTAHDPLTLYAITKSAGEAVVHRLAGLHGLEGVVARLGRVYGPYEHDTGVRDTLSQIHQTTRIARQRGHAAFPRPCLKNWSYGPDVAADLAALAGASTLAHRIYNLGSPLAWSLADWCERLARRFDGFRYTVGAVAADGGVEPVDLWGDRDGALLSWSRVQAEFPNRRVTDLGASFEDYMRFIDLQDRDGACA